MLTVDKEGLVVNDRVKQHIVAALQKGKLGTVHGIVVHQTGGSTATSAFTGYAARPFGTHFLIDKDGMIYQSASLLYYTNHVGKLKARCLAEHRCTPVEMKKYAGFNPKLQNSLEQAKASPDRYPTSEDSIGIELVGEFNAKEKAYVTVTTEQNDSLKWLVGELAQTFSVAMTEVFRHPDLSWKEPTEASTAQW